MDETNEELSEDGRRERRRAFLALLADGTLADLGDPELMAGAWRDGADDETAYLSRGENGRRLRQSIAELENRRPSPSSDGRERMREVSEALAQDPEYRAEIRRVQEDVEPYRTW